MEKDELAMPPEVTQTRLLHEAARSVGAPRRPRSPLAWTYLLSDACAGFVAATLIALVAPDDAAEVGALVAALVLPAVVGVAGRYRRAAVVLGERWFEDLLSLIFAATMAAWVGSLVAGLASSEEGVLRPLALWWAVALVIAGAGRGMVRPTAGTQRVLIVGAGDVGRHVAVRLAGHPEYGAAPVGFLDDHPLPEGWGPPPVPVLGTSEDLEAVIARERIDRVVVAFSLLPEALAADLVRRCADCGVQVDIVPRLFEILPLKPQVSVLEGTPLLTLPPRAGGRARAALKRTTDIAVAGSVLLVLTPLLAVLAALIKLDDGGPVFFRQERVGRAGHVFQMLKLRTMREGSGSLPEEGVIDKRADDPRVTGVGKLLRRLSLDELPQLWNVLRGDMSLVGPRPLPVSEARTVVGWQHARHEMRPGMTGLWQILGRSQIAFEERMRLDWVYVRYWSPAWDMRLLMRTFRAVLSARGAY